MVLFYAQKVYFSLIPDLSMSLFKSLPIFFSNNSHANFYCRRLSKISKHSNYNLSLILEPYALPIFEPLILQQMKDFLNIF
ncbi:hypothetical protein D7V32_13715 [Acinetobacter tianfuensis]|uniref:Uncharacterized protein n=1 Tax=Acinetobacter tianfuensis TaxID=2419603 RepID=A0A3A8E831_9GAMM|nr:hypothetical protein D7V32_13715 [Acinetobacter tianfuensis]